MLLLALGGAVSGADPGDFNGDGRLSPADAYFARQWLEGVFTPADGAAEFDHYPWCEDLYTSKFALPVTIFHESLRRLTPSPLPLTYGPWPEPSEPQTSPPPPDDRVVVEVLPAVWSDQPGTQPLREIQVRLTSSVPIDYFALVVRGDGIDLRPGVLRYLSSGPTRVWTQSYLFSHGLLAYTTGFLRLGGGQWPPSDRVLPVSVEVPLGTEPGEYLVELVHAEVVTGSGEVLTPRFVPGTIEVLEETTTGPDLPFPPLEFDLEAERILGSFELRVTEAEGHPGDTVTLTLQARPGRPANWVNVRLHFDALSIQIVDFQPLPRDLIEGEARGEDNYYCANNGASLNGYRGLVDYEWRAEGNSWSAMQSTTGKDQASLRYLAPLGEWIDLATMTFRIIEDRTGAGEAPIWFGYDTSVSKRHPAQFFPYYQNPTTDCFRQTVFEYDPVILTPGRVVILGEPEPPEEPPPPIDPEVAGITYEIGSAIGEPGDVVDVPIVLESAVDLHLLRLVLGYDPARLDFHSFRTGVSDGDGLPGELALTHGEPTFMNRICEGPDGSPTCRQGFPLLGILHGESTGDEVPEGIVIIDLATPQVPAGEPRRSWFAGERYELGSVRLRIRDDAELGSVEVAGVAAEWKVGGSPIATRSVTSGFPVLDPPPAPGERTDVPALEVTSGRVEVAAAFLRGDTDLDGDIVITDPVRTLGRLFLGTGALPCEDAADANDSGVLDITDPIYTLQFLFLGGPDPLPPYPEPGLDPTADPLRCGRG